jgi:Domain of unknown function (DUF4375)
MSRTKGTLTWKMLETRWAKGFDALEKEEQEALAVFWLQAETMNGGLDQFFHNSSGDMAPLALSALKRLNCQQTSGTGSSGSLLRQHWRPHKSSHSWR